MTVISRAAVLRRPFEQVECQEAPEPAVGSGQQNGLGFAGRVGDGRGGGQCLRVDELVQREVVGADGGGAAAVHARECRPFRAGFTFGLDVCGELPQVARRTDDDTDRHVDAEDVPQQVGEGQRRQRVAAEVGEM